MKTRLMILGAIVLVWVLVACALSDLLPVKQARITPTPTRTPKPTFTATATATPTLVPSATPTPSNTPTLTPVPTNTPVPTDTPTPTLTPTITATPAPSDTPTPTLTPTRRPAPKPSKTPVPKPTNTPPPPFTGTIVQGYPHCGGYAGVTGHVRHASGDPYANASIGVWSPTWVGAVAQSQADGKYDLSLTNVPPGHYFVAAVKLDTCTQQDGQYTAVDCKKLSNVLEVTKTEDCEVNQVTEVDFTGP